MRRGWIGLLTLTVAVASSFSISCGHKPAYSEVQTKDSQGPRASEQPVSNSSDQPATPPADETQSAKPEQAMPPTTAQLPETAPKKPVVSMPSFIDQTTGEFKDLPSYPKAYRTNLQIGPIGGAEAAMFLFETTESFQSIAAFYDKAIKKHGWTIASHIRDPEHLKWELIKGKTSEGLVEVKGDGNSNRKGIILSRAEKPQGK